MLDKVICVLQENLFHLPSLFLTSTLGPLPTSPEYMDIKNPPIYGSGSVTTAGAFAGNICRCC